METYREKLGRAAKLFEDARLILTNPQATAEEKAKIEPMLEDAKALKVEAGKLKDIEAFGAEIAAEQEKSQPAEQEKGERKDPKQFKAWNEFIYSAWLANHKDAAVRKVDPRLQYFREEKKPGMQQKDMVESVGASGGFLVPAEFQASLQAIAGESALVRGRATIIRMRRREIGLPVLDQTSTTSGIPHWFGGMHFHWGEEAAQKDQSDPSFREVQLVAHKLYGYTVASDELVDDSAISLSDFLSGPLGFAGGIAWMEDFAFIQGTGAGQPLGVINAGATITVHRAAQGAVSYDDLCDMLENFLPSGRGVWFISQSLLSELVQLTGPAANPSYIWGSAVNGAPGTLLGYPVIWTEKNPSIGNAGDVGLYDWRYYLIGDRQATTIESTQYDQWRYDKTSWRVVHRVDGQPWLSTYLTYQDGSTTVSPFVILGDKTT